jgi:ABC-type spermidine/putrescine transport system permease subunit I
MKRRENRRARWILTFTFVILFTWIPVALLVGHFVLGIDYHRLVQPVIVTGLVIVAFGPLFFWAQQSANATPRDFKRLDKVSTWFLITVFILFSVYGWYLGYFPSQIALIICVLCILIGAPSAYFLRRKLRSKARLN